MKKKKLSKLKKCIIGIVVTIAVLLGGFWALIWEDDAMTYIPFTGRIFSITPETVNWFDLGCKRDKTWYSGHDFGSDYAWVTEGKDPAPEAAEIAEKINSLRYAYWLPSSDGLGPVDYGSGGFSVGWDETGADVSPDCTFIRWSCIRFYMTEESVETLKELREYMLN